MKKITLFCFSCVLICANVVHAQKPEVVATLNDKTKALLNNSAADVLDLFHEKAKIFSYPKEELAKGEEAIAAYYKTTFDETRIENITRLDRMEYKGVVIDKEVVKTSASTYERLVFYKFKKEKIKTMIILVGKEAPGNSAEQIVDAQLKAYNLRNLSEFLQTYAQNVKVYKFPASLDYEGHSGLRATYKDLFKNANDLNCTITKRIVMGNVVIDKESVVANGNSIKAVAIYETENGRISKVSFM